MSLAELCRLLCGVVPDANRHHVSRATFGSPGQSRMDLPVLSTRLRSRSAQESAQEDVDEYYYDQESWARFEERLQQAEDYSNTWYGPLRTTPERPLFSRTPSDASPTEYEKRLGAELLADYHAG